MAVRIYVSRYVWMFCPLTATLPLALRLFVFWKILISVSVSNCLCLSDEADHRASGIDAERGSEAHPEPVVEHSTSPDGSGVRAEVRVLVLSCLV